MNRINSRKYDYITKELSQLLQGVDEVVGPTWYARNYKDAIKLIEPAHNRVQHSKIRQMAKFLEDTPTDKLFDNCSYFEQPNYYGYGRKNDPSIRGHNLDNAFDLIRQVPDYYVFYWEALNGSEYWMEQDQKRVIELLKESPEDFGVTVLCDISQIDNPEFYDERIMSEEDWDKINDLDCLGSDLIWHETHGFDVATLLNIVGAVDEMDDRWNGYDDNDDDCVLARLQYLFESNPVIAMMVAHEINEYINNTKMSWDRRLTACERSLTRGEEAAQ